MTIFESAPISSCSSASFSRNFWTAPPAACRNIFLELSTTRDSAAINLGDGALDRVLLENFHGVLDFVAGAGGCRHRCLDVSRRTVDHRFHGENLDGHLRQLFLHQAEIANLFSERFALFRVSRSGHQYVLRAAHARSA